MKNIHCRDYKMLIYYKEKATFPKILRKKPNAKEGMVRLKVGQGISQGIESFKCHLSGNVLLLGYVMHKPVKLYLMKEGREEAK